MKTEPLENSDQSVGSFNELRRVLSLREFWFKFAWEDIKTTYRRSLFGVLWVTLSFLAFIIVKSVVFIPIARNNQGSEYFIMYLTFGFLVWQFLSNVVNSAVSTFPMFEGWIRNDDIPLSGYPLIVSLKSLFNFALTALATIALFFLYPVQLGTAALSVIPAVILMILTSYFVTLGVGVISLRFRDFAHFVQTFMRAMFFVTPIFWFPEQLGDAMDYLWWNPFAHYIWIFRTPLLEGYVPWESWIFTGVTSFILVATSLTIYAFFRRRMVFWF